MFWARTPLGHENAKSPKEFRQFLLKNPKFAEHFHTPSCLNPWPSNDSLQNVRVWTRFTFIPIPIKKEIDRPPTGLEEPEVHGLRFQFRWSEAWNEATVLHKSPGTFVLPPNPRQEAVWRSVYGEDHLPICEWDTPSSTFRPTTIFHQIEARGVLVLFQLEGKKEGAKALSQHRRGRLANLPEEWMRIR